MPTRQFRDSIDHAAVSREALQFGAALDVP